MPVILYVVIGVVVLAAAVLAVIGLRSPQGEDALNKRLAEFAEAGRTATLEEIELSQPFAERIIFPIARRLGEFVLRFTPQNAIQDAVKKLEMAGVSRVDPTLFFASRIFGLSLGAFFPIISLLAPPNSMLKGKELLFAIPTALLGFFLPQLLISSKITRRQKEIRKAMPDALDLLTICVEAGLGFEAAMAKVYEKWDNELARAFGRVIREIQLGKIRREALRDMSERLGIAEMTSFVAAVIQSEQLGVSLAHVLRIQSDQMRVKRRQAAEEEAHKAPIKMLIPMALLIFPSICIILMTPAVIIILQSGFMEM